jgi:hypothetical protein
MTTRYSALFAFVSLLGPLYGCGSSATDGPNEPTSATTEEQTGTAESADTVCHGPAEQVCNCNGTQLRSCRYGAWGPWSKCTAAPKNFSTDVNNCGRCFHECTGFSNCVGGVCKTVL